jgi:hypothetical protein
MKKIVLAVAVLAGLFACAAPAVADTAPKPCERGEFCLWPGEDYQGELQRIALENANPGECVPLPEGFDARAFANRTKRPVTVYQGRDCATEAEFDTYPGGGTFVPAAPYMVRGVQIWEQ